MAKSKTFFGLRRGSTKTLTFSVFNGKQVTKDRVDVIKNPRSLSQMVQRMCMATSSAAYSAMKEIVDHSFEGVTYGLNSMSEFIRLNNKAIRSSVLTPANAAFAFNPYQNRNLYGGAFIMSSGSATPIPDAAVAVDSPSSDRVRVLLGVESETVNLTANDLYSSLGISVGDMCTVCFIAKDDTNAAGIFGFVRLRAKVLSTTTLTTANFTDFFDVESNFPIQITQAGNGIFGANVVVPGVVEDGDVAYCAIHSAKSDAGWLRSSAVMKVNDYVLSPTYEDAIATYPVGQSYVLNGGDIE